VADGMGISHSALTGADGRYLLSGVAFGAFTGIMARDGYITFAFSGTLIPGQALAIDGVLSPVLPAIFNVAVSNITTNSATITWVTNQPSDSLVEYGTESSYGSSVRDATLVQSHRMPLTNLSSNTMYHFRVTSANPYGFSTSSQDFTFMTLSPATPLAVTITYPRDGETIHRTDTRVEGTITNPTGVETGIVVNRVPAKRYGNAFIANHVALAEGVNTLTAVATDTIGNVSSSSVSVTSVPSEGHVRLASDTESGISPLELTLTVDSTLDLANSQLTYTGPGEIEFLSVTPSEYRIRISTEGTYLFTVTVADSDGTLYEDSTSITVFSKAEVDSMLREKWGSMKQALRDGDLARVLPYFTSETRELYSELFTALINGLPQIVDEMQEIQLIYVDGNVAKYRIRRNQIYGGLPHTLTYYIYFTVDIDGLWKIHRF